MKTNRTVLLLTLTLTAALYATPAAAAPAAAELRAKAIEVLKPLPDKAPGAEKDTPELVTLGKQLYFEKRLSSNNSQACNSCHHVENDRAGVDNEATSLGAFGKRGGRSAPTTLNAGFHFAQFWDGRAPDLAAQAKGPILNPIEMAMPDEQAVIKKLSAIAAYQTGFKSAFPREASPITYDNLARAIAAFERTLITHDRFDDFLKGDDHALTRGEKHGLKLFLETGCTTCHNGPVIGGTSFQKFGLVNPVEGLKDIGREEVSKDAGDRHKFKVPSLRNIALTYPYLHDGSSPTLEDTVRTMGWVQIGKKLTEDEIKSLVAFLKTLSDKDRVAVAIK